MFNSTKTHEITVDVVIFTIQGGTLKVRLVKRANDPFKEVAIYSSLIQMLILIARAYNTVDEHFIDIKPRKQ